MIFLELIVLFLNLFIWGPKITMSYENEEGLKFLDQEKIPKTRNLRFKVLVGDFGLTHANWIQLGKRSYKIYNDALEYEHALQRCLNHHPESHLAVVTSYKDSQILGKHLLRGKPRLANAWIGAKWFVSGYQFEPETILLQNSSDNTGYPPWKYNKIQKTDSCVLLDRHLTNVTVFLEAKCYRLRPYMCYIENNTGFVDFIRGEHGYRLHHSRRSWIEARNFCRYVYKNYSGRLAEIRDPIHFYDLLHVIKQAIVERVWIGGILNKSVVNPRWLWDSDDEAMPIGIKTRMRWDNTTFYLSRYEDPDACAVMDNSEKSYGMSCPLVYSYVCQFPSESLKKLQNHEKGNQKPTHCRTSPQFKEHLKKYDPEFWRQHSECLDTTKSLFSNWIQADQYLYQIFNGPVSFKTAKKKCLSQHPDVELAMVPTLKHAQVLKGHILFNKPFLESPWIDKPKQTQRKNCIAFNPHGFNNELFFESKCKQKRPYICYTKNGSGFTDLIIDGHGYRLYHNKKKWNSARNYCSIESGHLVEIKEPIIGYHLSKLIEKHGRGIKNVWVGGKLYKMGIGRKWFWENSCQEVLVENYDNETKYLSSMDENNCMAMEFLGKTYGIGCEYELNYVCQFSAEKLYILQKEEINQLFSE